MAGGFFTELLAATHPSRKNLVLPQEKLRAFSLPQDSQVELMFGAARFGEPALSVSRSLGFYIVPRRGDSPHRLGQTTQVLQSTADFRRNEIVRLAARPKHLQRRGVSQASARLRPRLAFGLPQGA
jgi:hypothetical protein